MIVALGLALSSLASTAHAQPPIQDPRAAAAVRLLDLEGPEAIGLAVSVAHALRDEPAAAALLARAHPEEKGELELVLINALEDWPARPDLALPFAVESLTRLPNATELCRVFATFRDAAGASEVALMSTLRRPASVDLQRWLECVGAWTLTDFEALVQMHPLRRSTRRSVVAAPLRPAAAATALAWLSAPGATLEAKAKALRWLEDVRVPTAEILAALDAATDTPALRDQAAQALAAALQAAPTSPTLPEPRLLALWRLHPKLLGAQLARRSSKIAHELARSFEGKSACELVAVLEELRPMPAPIVQWLHGELQSTDSARRECAALHGSKAAAYTPSLVEALFPHLPALDKTFSYGEILVGLIEAGAGKRLVAAIAAHLLSRPHADIDVAAALFRNPLPPEDSAALRRALLTPRAAGQPTLTFSFYNLLAVGPLSRGEALRLIDQSYDQRTFQPAELRAAAFVVTGGDDATYLASHLRSDAIPTLPAPLAPVPRQLELALEILAVEPGPRVASAALRLLKHHVDNTSWTAADRPRLLALLHAPSLALPAAAPLRQAIAAKLTALSPEPPLAERVARYALGLVGTHFLIWLALLWFVYPRSRLCQSLMLHNPWARKLTGLWYTQALVRAFPSLRRRMFLPLLESGAERDLGPEAGFNDKIQLCPVLPGETAQAPQRHGAAVAWTELLDKSGVLVIEGESGVGKSQVLRALLARARNARRTCVLLRAAECNEGVIRCIERVLELRHTDGFVDSLLYGGAIELFLDGLNEATPATVAEIASFCSRARHVRVYLTSQPMRWAYPAKARVWRLLPLTPAQLQDFLLSQWEVVQRDDLTQEAYEARVAAFLNERPFEEREMREQEVLRNRYDLAFVAYLLARGLSPNLHSLRQQVVDDVARTYAEAVPGGEFPLAALGALAVQVLENGVPALNLDKLDPVAVELLVERKLVLRRGDGTCIFRHDSITCYFAAEGVFAPLVTAERLDETAVSRERLSNQRFRGVYLQLAESRPVAAVERLALAVREFQREQEALTELDREVMAILDRRRRQR